MHEALNTENRAYLHVALLEVGGKAGHVLVVRQERVRLGAVEVDVPYAQQGEDHRDLYANIIKIRGKIKMNGRGK